MRIKAIRKGKWTESVVLYVVVNVRLYKNCNKIALPTNQPTDGQSQL